MPHCKSYFILVWCLILQVSHLDSSCADTHQPSGECRPQCAEGSLDCGHTNLDTFPDISLCRRQISVLDVSYNKIKTLPPDALAELTALETMVLSNNIIQSIPTGVFSDVTNLNELLLQSNNLSRLQPGVFQGLEGLDDRLMLRCNRLTMITTGVFDKLESINILAIDENWIETIEAYSFKGMRKLGYLYLKDNRIVRLVSGVFNGLGRLKRLDLRNNRIEVIESGAFEGLGDLEELKLSSNRITTVSGIPELHLLSSLNVANNSIKTVDNPFLLDMLHGDLKISIKDNPLDCTCKMEAIRVWYRTHEETTDDARCATPAEYLNMTLDSIKEPLPECPVPSGGRDQSTLDGKGNAEGLDQLSSFVIIIPVAGLLVLSICIYFVVRWHTSKKQPVSGKPRNNLEQQPEYRVDTYQLDGYEPDGYHSFLPQDDTYNSTAPAIESPPPSLNGHAFRLSIEDGTSDLPSPTPAYLSVDDVNDPQSDEDNQAPLAPTRFKQLMRQTRPVTHPAVPPRFFSSGP